MRHLLLPLLALLVVYPSTAQDTALRTGRVVSGSLASGETDVYTFEARSDAYVRGLVNQVSVDVVVRVVDPAGKEVRTWDGPAAGPEHFQFETESAGRFRIEVSPFEENEGAYSIVLNRLEPVATDPKRRADQLLSLYDRTDGPGVAVNVFRGGRSIYKKAFGMADLALDVPYEVSTRTNIGSTSKQFTAFAILLLAEEGKLSLDDDVRTHIPELPDLGETVTIRNLLTHTTGFREFLNLVIMSGRDLGHGDWIRRDEIVGFVQRQPKLQNSPGSEWNYNNTAFALAAQIVERISEKPFHEFMAERVFGPLGMARTMVRPTPEHIVPGRSMGYAPSPDGGYLEKRDLGGAVGAGGIYSTVEDLQIWIENYGNPRVGTPGMIGKMTTRFVLTDGDTTGYGLGLFIDELRGLRRVQHGGADIAHRSALAWYPDIDAGVTTQSNDASFDSGIAAELAETFFGEFMEPEEEPVEVASDFDPANYDPEAFDEFVGRYALDDVPNFILIFFREDSTLYTQATGQPRIELAPTSDSTFAITAVEASIDFHRDADGHVVALTLNQGGANRATRLPDEAEDEGGWEPTLDALSDFAGRYFSEEVETFYTVAVEDSALVLKHRRMDDISLTPGEEDTFTSGVFTPVTFERDRNGRIIAFYLANGRTRDVRFRKLD